MLDPVKERLLDAAGAVFAERGFAAATVREICARADANLAAVNYHFGDKERLYIEAVKAAHARRLAEIPAPVPSPETTPVDRLRLCIRTMLQRMVFDAHQPPWCAQLVMRELAVPSTACRELTQEFIRPQFEQLLTLVSELVPPGTPARRRHLVVFSIVGQCLHHRLARPIIGHLVGADEQAGYDLDRLTDHITSFTLHGLSGAAADTGRRVQRRQQMTSGRPRRGGRRP
ncbi:MAG TPA: CerR family C-terminal domain-containing protein [Gemmatales bacterium]|nr:CerR family C-terminal domain-containing protein [Gemmatales bacterium]